MRSFPIAQCSIALFALAVFIGSLHAHGGVGRYGAGFMPTVLGALLFVFTLIDAAIAYRHSTKHRCHLGAGEMRAIFTIIVSVTLFTLFVDTLGFIVCATCLVFALTGLRRPRKLLSSLIFAIIAALSIDYLFADLLMVALPQGIWG